MSLIRVLGTIGLAACAAAPSNAKRVVNYPTNETGWGEWSKEQGVPIAASGERLSQPIGLFVAPSVDHDVVRVGIACSAWSVANPISGLIRTMFEGAAPMAKAGEGQAATVQIDSASTVSRCVSSGEMKAICITRVTLRGSISKNSADPSLTPITASVEFPARGVGACAGLTRGIGLISRNAAQNFIDQVRQKLTNN